MSWDQPYASSIATDLAALTPLHDFVLIEPFETPPGTLIIDPGMKMTRDFRWVSPRPRGNRYGTVVAVGAGDRLLWMTCKCRESAEWVFKLETAKKWSCSACGEPLEHGMDLHTGEVPIFSRAPMNVKPGDIVVYAQRPANEVVLNHKKYVLLHEEQDVLAVVEDEAVAA